MSKESTAKPQAARSLRAALLTSVGGSVLQRLQEAFPDGRGRMRVVSSLSPERWRNAMRGSQFERARTRLVGYVGFPLRAVRTAAEAPRAEVFVASTNPFFLPAVMVATRCLHGKRVVVLVYDLFPEALIAAGVLTEASVSSRLMREVNRYSLQRADGVVFIGKHMAARVKSLYGEPKKSCVIETGAVGSEFRGDSAREPESKSLSDFCEGKLVLSYVGNMGHVHDWLTLAEGIEPLLLELPHLVVVIAASGANVRKLQERWAAIPSDRVRFEGPLGDRDWIWLTARTDIALVTLKETAKHTSIPSKAFSAMAAGSALLAVAPEGSDLREVCEESGGGIVVSPGDSLGLTQQLRILFQNAELLEQLKRRASTAFSQHYEMSVLAHRWADFLEELPPVSEYPLKRTLDVALIALGAPLLLPLTLATAVACRVFVGSPILFRQSRPGKDGVHFELIKFRSMKPVEPGGEEGTETDGARLTRFGRLMRELSLDELPSLYNVLKGDMSLVGPRPLFSKYWPLYSAEQRGRHDVRPGVTGWAQVRGRNEISWSEKFAFDLEYVADQSLSLDIKVLLMTVVQVLSRRGISSVGHPTMPEFLGETPESP